MTPVGVAPYQSPTTGQAAAATTDDQPLVEPQDMNSDAVNPGHETGAAPLSQDGAARSSADEDAGLLQAFAGGDARAFEALYQKHRPWLYRVILRQVGDPDLAEGIFQEVWLTVTRRAPDWTPQAQVATWLYGIARSRIVAGWSHDEAGSVDRRPAIAADAAGAPGPDPALNRMSASITASLTGAAISPNQRLMRTLGDLPPLQREAYLLAVEAGLSLPEVARATGSTLDGARARVWGARVRLATILEALPRAGA